MSFRWRDRFNWQLICVLLLAAVLRVGAIGRESLWYDETLTRTTAGVPFTGVLRSVIALENTPPLYFFLINGWAHAFGRSDLPLRLPSMIFGVASVGVIYSLGRRFTSDRLSKSIGLSAALLLAISRYHIAYSQQARCYSLLFFWCALSCDLFARLIDCDCRRKMSTLYVLVSAAALWTHPFAGLVLVTQDLYLLFARIPLRKWMILQGAVVLLYWPWLHQLSQVYATGQPWMPMPTIEIALARYTDTWVCQAMLGLLCAIGIWRQRRTSVLFALLLLIVPLTPIFASTSHRVLFTPRYGIAALIGICWLAAIGAISLGRIGGSLAILFICLAVSPHLLHDLRNGTTSELRADIKHAALAIDRSAQPGDGVFCPDFQQATVMAIYSRRSDLISLQALPTGRFPKRIWLIASDSPQQLTRGSAYRVDQSQEFDGVMVAELRAD